MPAFRMTKSSYRCILPIMAICGFVVILPQPGEPSSANSMGRTGTLNQVPSAQQQDLLARRVAALSSRLSLRQLPEIDGDFTRSLSMASGDFNQDGIQDLIVGHAGA